MLAMNWRAVVVNLSVQGFTGDANLNLTSISHSTHHMPKVYKIVQGSRNKWAPKPKDSPKFRHKITAQKSILTFEENEEDFKMPESD